MKMRSKILAMAVMVILAIQVSGCGKEQKDIGEIVEETETAAESQAQEEERQEEMQEEEEEIQEELPQESSLKFV